MVNLFNLLLIFTLLQNAFLQKTTSSKYVIGFWPGGMGVCLSSTLNHLVYCEKYKLIPVVYWHKSLYHSPFGFNNKLNEWEYYFKPVSNLSYQQKDKVNHFCNNPNFGSFNYYNTSEEKRNLAHQLMCKYISLNARVQAKVEQFYDMYMKNKKTIGIHIRGTDKLIEEKPVPTEKVVFEAMKYADEHTQFFIATDEQKIFDHMLNLLNKEKVVFYDCYRSKDGRPLHTRNKPSRAQLGEDVIVEMWLMARCTILIHTLSNVSSIPLYLNPKLKHIALNADSI